MSFQTPTRSTRPPLPTLPATPESSGILSSPVATSFSSPTPGYWGTPAGGLWPSTSGFIASNTEGTPVTENSANLNLLSAKNSAQDSGKRGRPRADHISQLIHEGINSPSGIKCRVCNRTFPREKSLQVRIFVRKCVIFRENDYLLCYNAW